MTQYLIGLATNGLIISIIAFALNVRWGWAGEFDISLFAVVAVGAYTYSVITLPPSNLPAPGGYILGLREPFLLGLVAAVVVAGLVSAVIGLIALRKLRDDYFGITTLAFALVMALVIGQYNPLFDGFEGLFAIPQPLSSDGTLGQNGGWYLGIVFIAIIFCIVILQRLFKSPFGRAVRSVREDEIASQTFGRNAYSLKLKAFILGGCLAGLGGALTAAYITAFNPYGWTPQETFLIYAALFIGGTGNTYGAIFGTFFVEVGVQEITRQIPQIGTNASGPDAIRLILIGLLIVAILWWRPQGLIPEPRAKDRIGEVGAQGWLMRVGQRALRRTATLQAAGGPPTPAGALVVDAPTELPPIGSRASLSVATQEKQEPGEQTILLAVKGLNKAFGGVKAVNDANLSVPTGSLTGLIGPNGAGKSTMINLISGLEKPDSGTIVFGDKNIDGMPPHRVGRMGLLRTFQTPREWGGLTVMENMLLGAPAGNRETIWRGLVKIRALRTAEYADRLRARELLEEVGLTRLKDEPAVNLSGGQKRLLEFARLAISRPRLVLLDEPSAGVNPVLRERMAELIRNMITSGVTVLMVEHNLAFLESLCENVIVMALGRCIATGSMAELRANQTVVDAYLGQVNAADV